METYPVKVESPAGNRRERAIVAPAACCSRLAASTSAFGVRRCLYWKMTGVAYEALRAAAPEGESLRIETTLTPAADGSGTGATFREPQPSNTTAIPANTDTATLE